MTTDLLSARGADELHLIDELLGRYAQVVDDQEWASWPELFAAECTYQVQTFDNARRELPLAYMLDDSRARLLDRVKFITEVWAGTIEPYRTRHIGQRTSVRALDPTSWAVRTNLQVSYSEADQPPAILATGYYDDVIVLVDGQGRFRDRRVYLDGMPSRYLVYPL